MSQEMKPCHFSFTLTRAFSGGGTIQAQFLEADSKEELPIAATGIRPLHEGEELLAGSGVVHSHIDNGSRKSPFSEYKFVGTAPKEPLQSMGESLLMSLVNRVIPG